MVRRSTSKYVAASLAVALAMAAQLYPPYADKMEEYDVENPPLSLGRRHSPHLSGTLQGPGVREGVDEHRGQRGEDRG